MRVFAARGAAREQRGSKYYSTSEGGEPRRRVSGSGHASGAATTVRINVVVNGERGVRRVATSNEGCASRAVVSSSRRSHEHQLPHPTEPNKCGPAS